MILTQPLTQDLPVPKSSLFLLSQCPFLQVIDTDITYLLNYIKLDLARLHAMILTSPPPLPHLKRLGMVGAVSVPSDSHPQT
jgi:hypothetical protein